MGEGGQLGADLSKLLVTRSQFVRENLLHKLNSYRQAILGEKKLCRRIAKVAPSAERVEVPKPHAIYARLNKFMKPYLEKKHVKSFLSSIPSCVEAAEMSVDWPELCAAFEEFVKPPLPTG